MTRRRRDGDDAAARRGRGGVLDRRICVGALPRRHDATPRRRRRGDVASGVASPGRRDAAATTLRRAEAAARPRRRSRIGVLASPRPRRAQILDQNGDGDVYVKEVTAGGNAAGMSGQVQKGDVIQMCSATFGGQMWSTRGAGLDRVTRAIEVRAGPTVTLVLQSKAEQRNFLADIFAGQSAAQERRVEEAENKARALEDEVKAERKEAAKGFFGLF